MAGEADLAADFRIGLDDPGIGRIGQDLTPDERFDTALLQQRDLLEIAQFAVRFVFDDAGLVVDLLLEEAAQRVGFGFAGLWTFLMTRAASSTRQLTALTMSFNSAALLANIPRDSALCGNGYAGATGDRERVLTLEYLQKRKQTPMDKIFSTRLDESIIVELERVTKRHGMTKKRFIEEAIQEHARKLTAGDSSNVWSETFGTWKRKETAAQTVKRARNPFRNTFRRHHP